LWRADEFKPEDETVLLEARERGGLVDLEEEWWNAHEGVLPRDIPFQPYAAITQWLMDDLSRKYA
jgi:hypothetical protein